MDSTENTSSAIDIIDTVSFKTGVKGYRIQEVDDYLERLSVEIRQLKDQLQQARQVSRQAAERINQLESGRATTGSTGPTPIVSAAPAPAPRPVSRDGANQVSSMIAMAQEFIDQKQSEAEAKATHLIGEAQDRAREIISEARSRAEDEVNRLNGLKQRLSEDVDTLGRQLESEKARLGAFLNEFSRWIEGALSFGGAARPATPARQPAPAPQPAPQTHVPPRPSTPPPAAPAPSAPQQTIGQVLSFDQQSQQDRT